VLDRSELILDIFASRATTVEAQLQVELAQLEYTYPRLKAMWSHLERIVGGAGLGGIGTRGPGEMQIEIDRRLVNDRKVMLRRRLEVIQERKRRTVAARNLDYFTVGIVGYTNAGKSTLFNALTAGGAYADDRLFATLTTRTREWDVEGGLRVMLSDTVGFVRELPHNLIASFKATLEEATHAHLLLIVLDVSDPAAELQYATVMTTLDEIFKDVEEAELRRLERGEKPTWKRPRTLLLLNKVDRLPDNRQVLIWQARVKQTENAPMDAIAICARDMSHPGIEQLKQVVLDCAQGGVEEMIVEVPMRDSRTVSLLEQRASEVLSREYTDDTAVFHVQIGRRQLDQLKSAVNAQGGTIAVREAALRAPAKAKAAKKSKSKAKVGAGKSRTKAK
jgi:GTP-binding protein HflX